MNFMSVNSRIFTTIIVIFYILCLAWVGPAAAGNKVFIPGELEYSTNVFKAEAPFVSVGDYVYQVKVVQTRPADKAANVLIKDPILVLLDQPVKIIAPEKIQLLKFNGGTTVDNTGVSVEGRTIIMTVSLEYNTDYQVVLGERALESTVSAAVYNAPFDWTFSTEKASDSGEDGGDDSNGDEGGT